MKIYFDNMEIPSDAIMGLHQEGSLFSDSSFKLGSTICRQFDLRILKMDSMTGDDDGGVFYSMYPTIGTEGKIGSDANGVFYTSDEEITELYIGKDSIGVYCTDEEIETVDIPEIVRIYDDNEDLYATLYVDSYDENDLRSVSFTLTDGMILLNKNYDFSTISPASAQSVLNALCSNVLGCQNVAIAYGGDINLNYSSDVMARDIVSWIAEINGCYARVDASGQLELIRFSNDNPASIDINMCADFRLGEYHRIERVYCELATATRYYPTDYTGEYDTLYLNPLNELITDSGNYTVAQTVEHVYSLISGFEFYSLVSSRCVINQNSWPGDPLQFVLGNVSYPTITQIDWDYNVGWYGGYSLEIETKQQQDTSIKDAEIINRVKILVDRETGTISQQISQIDEELNQNIADLTMTADGLRARVAKNETDIAENDSRLQSLELLVTIRADGVYISQGEQAYNDGFYTKFTDNGMEIYVEGNKTAWAEADGFSAEELMVGGANDTIKWHMHMANGGNSLMILRR